MSALASARPGDPQPLHRRGRPAADDRRRAYGDEPPRRIALSLSTLAALPTLAALSALARGALARCGLARYGDDPGAPSRSAARSPLARCTLAHCAPVLAALALAPQLAHAAPVSLPAANAPPTNPHSFPATTTRPADPHSLPDATAPAASPSSSSTPARDPLAPPPASPSSPSTPALDPLARPAASSSTPALDPIAPAPAPTRNAAALKAEADSLFRAGDLPGAATLWAELAAHLEPGPDRYLLIWKALGSWERAFAADHDHRHLCAARDLALAVLRDHLRLDHRLEFELRLQALDRSFADLGDPTILCIAASPSSASPPRAASTTPAAATPNSPPASNSSSPTATPAVQPPTAADATTDRPTSAGRPALIAGAITLPLGAAVLGLMTYAILEDARQIAIVDNYDAKNQSVGLTPDEAAEARDALARARAASYLTLGSGITGAALTLTGTALLVHGQRQRRRHLALVPALAPTGAALTLSGRF